MADVSALLWRWFNSVICGFVIVACVLPTYCTTELYDCTCTARCSSSQTVPPQGFPQMNIQNPCSTVTVHRCDSDSSNVTTYMSCKAATSMIGKVTSESGKMTCGPYKACCLSKNSKSIICDTHTTNDGCHHSNCTCTPSLRNGQALLPSTPESEKVTTSEHDGDFQQGSVSTTELNITSINGQKGKRKCKKNESSCDNSTSQSQSKGKSDDESEDPLGNLSGLENMGIGIGVGIGFCIIIAVLVCLLFYCRHLGRKEGRKEEQRRISQSRIVDPEYAEVARLKETSFTGTANPHYIDGMQMVPVGAKSKTLPANSKQYNAGDHQIYKSLKKPDGDMGIAEYADPEKYTQPPSFPQDTSHHTIEEEGDYVKQDTPTTSQSDTASHHDYVGLKRSGHAAGNDTQPSSGSLHSDYVDVDAPAPGSQNCSKTNKMPKSGNYPNTDEITHSVVLSKSDDYVDVDAPGSQNGSKNKKMVQSDSYLIRDEINDPVVLGKSDDYVDVDAPGSQNGSKHMEKMPESNNYPNTDEINSPVVSSKSDDYVDVDAPGVKKGSRQQPKLSKSSDYVDVNAPTLSKFAEDDAQIVPTAPPENQGSMTQLNVYVDVDV